MTEHEIQNEIFRTFGTRPELLLMRQNVGLAVPSGVVLQALALLRKGDVYKAATVLATARPIRFGMVGQADITGIMLGGRRLEIEVKAPAGKQSPEQVNYQRMIEKHGGRYILARSVQDVEQGLSSGHP